MRKHPRVEQCLRQSRLIEERTDCLQSDFCSPSMELVPLLQTRKFPGQVFWGLI